MGVENLVLDAEGEYVVVAEALRGINVNIGPKSSTVINIFDIETEIVKDEITGKERYAHPQGAFKTKNHHQRFDKNSIVTEVCQYD